MKKKICLVQPTYRDRAGQLAQGRRLLYGSLALPALSAAIPPDWEKEFCLEYFEDVRYDTDASVVGISSMGYDIIHGFEIAAEFRRRGKKVLFGGPMAWLSEGRVRRECDAVVLGHPRPGDLAAILGDALAGRLTAEYRCGMAADFPFDYSVLSRGRWDLLPVTASLGCRGTCAFCCTASLYGGGYRTRVLDTVVADLWSVRQRGRRAVFIDTNIGGDRGYLLRLCRRMEEERLGLEWAAQCTVDLGDDAEALEAMRSAGCLLLIAGFETLVQGNLDRFGKPVRLERHAERAHRIRKAGIALGGYFMLGLDEDTPASFPKTFEFIRDNGVALPVLNLLLPSPGTRTYDELKQEGRLLVGTDEEYEHAITGMLSSTVCSRCFYAPKRMSAGEAEDAFLAMYGRLTTWREIARRSLGHGLRLSATLLAMNLAMRRDRLSMAGSRALGRLP
jgi:hypothetical protein